MCFYSDEGSYPYREKVTRARKQHHCIECPDPIKPGDFCLYVAGLYDGVWFDMRFCARCHFVRSAIASVERSRGCDESESWPPSGTLAEDWLEGNYPADLGLFDPSDDAEPPKLYDIGKW